MKNSLMGRVSKLDAMAEVTESIVGDNPELFQRYEVIRQAWQRRSQCWQNEARITSFVQTFS